jgi:hypothetical protein
MVRCEMGQQDQPYRLLASANLADGEFLLFGLAFLYENGFYGLYFARGTAEIRLG